MLLESVWSYLNNNRTDKTDIDTTFFSQTVNKMRSEKTKPYRTQNRVSIWFLNVLDRILEVETQLNRRF